MERRSLNPVVSRQFLAAVLNNLDSVAGVQGLLNTSQIDLYTNAFDPNPDMVDADFTIATFVGYAAVASVAWMPAGNVGAIGMVVEFDALFTAGAIVAPGQQVEGYVVRETAGAGEIYFAERFVTPVNFAIPADFLHLDAVAELRFVWPVTA